MSKQEFSGQASGSGSTITGMDEVMEIRGRAIGARNVTPGGHTVDYSYPAFPTSHRKYGNPAPLGLCSFAISTFVLSLINLSAGGVSTPGIMIGLALIVGGLLQILAAMWEFLIGNTFPATVFAAFGAFWASYAMTIMPAFQIETSYTSATELKKALGFFIFGWFTFACILTAASFRSSKALVFALFTILVVFIALGTSEFVSGAPNLALKKAAGGLGLLVAFQAWYIAAAALITKETSYFSLPLGSLAKVD